MPKIIIWMVLFYLFSCIFQSYQSPHEYKDRGYQVLQDKHARLVAFIICEAISIHQHGGWG